MSDETPNDKKDEKVDLNASLDAINKSVNQKMDQGFQDLTRHIDSKLEASKPDKNDDFDDASPDDDADDDGYITKKDLKRHMKSLIEDVNKVTKKTVNESIDERTHKYSRDEQAKEDFPMLNTKTSEYNQAFYNEVEAEVTRKIKSGRNNEDPDLIYDAAAAVEKKWIKDGKYVPRAVVERLNNGQNTMEDSFEVSATSNKSTTPNQRQVELARRFNLPKERLAQHMKRIG